MGSAPKLTWRGYLGALMVTLGSAMIHPGLTALIGGAALIVTEVLDTRGRK